MSIFVSIASYCDPVLRFTVERALAGAREPDRLHFGVVDQSPQGTPRLLVHGAARITQVRVDPLDARGPCWARAIGMSFYDGEDWFLQIDSHMDFESGWDERLIEQARALLPGRPGVVLSAYPNPFVFDGDVPVRKPATQGVLAHVVKHAAVFDAGHPVLGFEAHPVETAQALPGFHLGAGCLFAPGRFVEVFPYDPFLYFHGEEQALALRVFTHGWDIFHVPGLPIYHLYNTSEAKAARPMHWDAGQDARRSVSWWKLEERSRQRVDALVKGQLAGAYGLGAARSVADYAAFSGIDYAARTIEPRAYKPKTD